MTDFSLGCVVSTRIRLARNLEGYPFPCSLYDDKSSQEIIRGVSSAMERLDDFKLFYMDAIAPEQAELLKENHLISPALIACGEGSAVLINDSQTVSIMINEEDHLREQCILNGFCLAKAYQTMAKIDRRIGRSIKFAYDEQLGYLTACPTNLGTGLRASVMLFLPAVILSGYLDKIMQKISSSGLTVRGVYGEGSDAEGYLVQVSNEVTLGLTEEEILSEVEAVTQDMIELEISERQKLLTCANAVKIKDRCLRAFGVLSNCATLTEKELSTLSADVKLGVCLGYLATTDIEAIDKLVVSMRPANLHQRVGRHLSATEQDAVRATQVSAFMREKIKRNTF